MKIDKKDRILVVIGIVGGIVIVVALLTGCQASFGRQPMKEELSRREAEGYQRGRADELVERVEERAVERGLGELHVQLADLIRDEVQARFDLMVGEFKSTVEEIRLDAAAAREAAEGGDLPPGAVPIGAGAGGTILLGLAYAIREARRSNRPNPPAEGPDPS